ncbi:MAG: DUF4364 family protein [Clostridia bacterium]|nr:DUF4364 family protein [Clostridia bacterium]MBR2973355.1 DUF4364 family protein [Clostridia bacterium]
MRAALNKDFNIKIALLYIIDKFGGRASDVQITEVFSSVCGTNYFSMKQCEYELEKEHFIHSYYHENELYYMISERGSEALSFMSERLIHSLRTEITEYVKNFSASSGKSKEFISEAVPVSDLEYNVHIKYDEFNMPALELSFRAGGRKEAQALAKLLEKHKEKIYKDLYSYIINLTNEEE